MHLCYSFFKAAWIQLHERRVVYFYSYILSALPANWNLIIKVWGDRDEGVGRGLPCWSWDLVHPLPFLSVCRQRWEDKWRERGGRQWKGKVGRDSGKLGLQLEFQLAAQRNLRHFWQSEILNDKKIKETWSIIMHLSVFRVAPFQLLMII